VLHETHETAASQWICRAPARDVGKAKSYQFFTDLANPVSNRIYERIGYRRVGTRATIAW
jgi:predicted GNAT family acetyltransferase